MSLLSICDLGSLTVQEMWNYLEVTLVNAIDIHAPLSILSRNLSGKITFLNPNFKRKMNKRKRLLKYNKEHNSTEKSPEIKILNKEICSHFRGIKISNVKKAAMGIKGNIWKAIKIAKNLNEDSVPKNLSRGEYRLQRMTLLTLFIFM